MTIKEQFLKFPVWGWLILSVAAPQIGGGALSALFFIALIIRVILGRNDKKKNQSTQHSKEVKLVKTPEDYTDYILLQSATAAQRMKSEHHLTDSQSSEIMLQIFAFCIINLMRRFKTSHIPTPNGQNFIDKAIKAASILASDKEHADLVYRTYGSLIGDLSNKFGNLPLSHSNSEKLGGTFIWEYAKNMNHTMGKDKLDLEIIMKTTSIITNINNSVNTDHIIDSLK